MSLPKIMYIATLWCTPKVKAIEVVRLTDSSYWTADHDGRRARSTDYELLCETYDEARNACIESHEREVEKHERYLENANRYLEIAKNLPQSEN